DVSSWIGVSTWRGPRTDPPRVPAARRRPAALAAPRRAGPERPARRRARGTHRRGAEPGLVPPRRTAVGGARDRTTQLGRRARQLLPVRPRALPRAARRDGRRAASRAC